MQSSETRAVRTLSHLLFIDVDGRRRVARAVPNTIFDETNVATIGLSAKPDGFVVAPANAEPPKTTVDNHRSDRLSLGHLQNILSGIVPKISDGFIRLGIPVPPSKDAVTHDEILKLLRAAMTHALSAATTSDTPAGTPHKGPAQRTTIRAIETKTKFRPIASLRENSRVDGLDGMQRAELEQGTNSALEALFVLLHAKGLTAIPDLKAWCEANTLWPPDSQFTEQIRRAIAAKLLLAIEEPAKIGTGLHESIPPPPTAGVAS
jgi:hypothetical protein